MYELVNTSLPNGLIAGTHGFATVAMTKGVQDVLRGRLEALCASHECTRRVVLSAESRQLVSCDASARRACHWTCCALRF